MNNLERDMMSAARDLLGSGFVVEYYRNAASDFLQIAEAAIADAYKRGKEEGRRSAYKPSPLPTEPRPEVEDVFG